MKELTTEDFHEFLTNPSRYPKEKRDFLFTNPKVETIGSRLLNGNFVEIKPEDFKEIVDDPYFLISCGNCLKNYGEHFSNKYSLKLSIEIFDFASTYFDVNTEDYAEFLLNKGCTVRSLAKIGCNKEENLKKSIELFEEAERIYGVDTYGYVCALNEKAVSKKALALMGSEPIENLRESIEIYEIIRETIINYSLRKDPLYLYSMGNEVNSRNHLGDFGDKPQLNFEESIKLSHTLIESFDKDSIEYITALLNKANTHLFLGEYYNAPKIKEYEFNMSLKCINKGKTLLGHDYQNSDIHIKLLLAESIAYIRLAEIGVSITENLENAIRLLEYIKKEMITRKNEHYINTLINEGSARLRLSEYNGDEENLDLAEKVYLEIKQLLKGSNDKIALIGIDSNLGRSFYAQEKYDKAYSYLKNSIKIIESLRNIIEIPDRANYFKTEVNAYKSMVLTCFKLNKYDEAFFYTESLKGRVLLDVLGHIRHPKVRTELMDKYITVSKKISKILLKDLMGKISDKEQKELERLKTLKINLDKDMKDENPEFFSIDTVTPITVDKLSSLLKGKTLLEYFVGNKLIIFVFNGKLIAKEVEIDEIQLKLIVDDLRNNLDDSEYCKPILEKLYNILINPVVEHLTDEVVIIPHSYLIQVPFYALKGNKYLIEEYKMSFAPSASSLEFLNKTHGNKNLIVGDPENNLDGAREEALELSKLITSETLIGNNATKDNVLDLIEGNEIIHFACHGYFNHIEPNLSGVKLADGILDATDLLNLEIDAKLVTISACGTALSDVSSGELEGLIRSFQIAGCRYVIASLWNVDDGATKEFFLNFYKKKGDIVSNIQGAILDLMVKYDFYYWAPFQLYGI